MISHKYHPNPGALEYTQKTGHSNIALLAIAALLILGIGVAKTLLSDTISLWRELKSGKAYETALAEKILTLEEAQANLATINIATQAEINNTVPDNPSQARILEELATDAGMANLSLVALSFGTKEVVGKLGRESFQAALTGQATNLTSLIEEVSRGRLTAIRSLSYNQRDIKAAGEIAITLNADGYFYSENKDD